MNYKFLIPKALALIDLPTGRSKHFSFLLKRRKIVGFGYNRSYDTHPIAYKYGYLFSGIHSELDCILSFNHAPRELHRCTMVNLRFLADGTLSMSKPCKKCQELLRNFNIDKIVYTNRLGEFVDATF